MLTPEQNDAIFVSSIRVFRINDGNWSRRGHFPKWPALAGPVVNNASALLKSLEITSHFFLMRFKGLSSRTMPACRWSSCPIYSLEVDGWTGFSRHLEHAGGAEPRAPELLVHCHASILAQACNFGLTRMAQLADLSYRQLAWCTTLVFARGNTQTRHRQHRQPRDNRTAIPRYFGYGRGLTFYTEVRLKLRKLQSEYLLDLADVVVAVKDERGNVKLHHLSMALTQLWCNCGRCGSLRWGLRPVSASSARPSRPKHYDYPHAAPQSLVLRSSVTSRRAPRTHDRPSDPAR